ncbi:MAG: hypothetical protein ACOC0P_06490, partial [Planctomycetota bacterium]
MKNVPSARAVSWAAGEAGRAARGRDGGQSSTPAELSNGNWWGGALLTSPVTGGEAVFLAKWCASNGAKAGSRAD